MANIIRFGISIDVRLLGKFDSLIDEKGYSNRSEAIRDRRSIASMSPIPSSGRPMSGIVGEKGRCEASD